MPLPDQFNESEFLQDTLKRYENRLVRDYFIELGGDDWDPDVSTPRSALRYACTHKDDDSMTMTVMRVILFEQVRLFNVQVPYYGIPVSSFQESRRFKPQITLYFQEDPGDVDPSFAPVAGEISFRLMNHTSSSLNPSVAQTFANRIRSEFVVGGGYIWRKGKEMYSYSDWSKGYQLQLLCRNEGTATELINKVLDIQQDAFDPSKMNKGENKAPAQAYPVIPPNDLIYGQSRRTPRKRPIADVRFQYAVLNIHGLQNPVPLVDRSGIWPNALAS